MTGVYHTEPLNYHAAGPFPVGCGVIHFDHGNVLHQFATRIAFLGWQRTPLQHLCAVGLKKIE